MKTVDMPMPQTINKLNIRAVVLFTAMLTLGVIAETPMHIKNYNNFLQKTQGYTVPLDARMRDSIALEKLHLKLSQYELTKSSH